MKTEPLPSGPGHDPKEYWEKSEVAEHFASLPPPTYLADVVPVSPSPRALALDVGCGGGRNLPLLADRGYRLIALDLHHVMACKARSLALPGSAIVQGTVTQLPVRGGSIAFAICHGVLHNLAAAAEIRRALVELRRVAAADGLLSLNVFSSRHIDDSLRRVSGNLFALENGQRMVLLPPTEIADLCARTGWQTHDGPPHEYLSPGDIGLRSVWRAALKAA